MYLLKIIVVGRFWNFIWVYFNINGIILFMEFDIVLIIFVINKEMYEENFLDVNLIDMVINLRIYLGESIVLLGVCMVIVDLND